MASLRSAQLRDDFEQKLDEDKQLRMTLEDEKQELNKEFDEIKLQLEDDIDTEIQSMRSKYDQQLAAEREATLRYKGENGIMRKKFSVLQKEIEDQKEEVSERGERALRKTSILAMNPAKWHHNIIILWLHPLLN